MGDFQKSNIQFLLTFIMLSIFNQSILLLKLYTTEIPTREGRGVYKCLVTLLTAKYQEHPKY